MTDLTSTEVDKISIDIDYETYDLIKGMQEKKDKEVKRIIDDG
ncbi:hypothetical protein LCGC14_1081230 [marine sediment metagenome]|uniref:Uncharacterized protein n=1 Tax=marine sediment metagenome TaxID=412755 RepID=A0A0F9MF84_9ZZZZ